MTYHIHTLTFLPHPAHPYSPPEMARLEDHLTKLHKSLNVPDLRDLVIVERALETAIQSFPGIRDVCLFGVSEQAGKPLTLVQVTPLVLPYYILPPEKLPCPE